MKIKSHPFSFLRDSYYKLSLQKVFLVWFLLSLSLLFLLLTLITINNKIVITIPKRGGVIQEGIIGTPRYINPILAISNQDESLSSLVFSGLTKIDRNNQVKLDMAKSIEKSEDLLTYTVTLKDNLYFHDNKKVTSEDVLFTISLIQNPLLKSPLKIKWEGVKVEKISDTKVLFTLKQPYPLFERSLAVGILPKHIWKNLTLEEIAFSDQNLHAIGSGPYKIEKVDLVSGIPRVFTLTENKNYALGRPYIYTIILHSYTNEKALEQAFIAKEITSFSTVSHLLSTAMSDTSLIKESMTLPQTYSIFLNPNKQPFLADKDIRAALQIALHKEMLIKELYGESASTANTHYPFSQNADIVREYADPKILIEKSNFRKKNASSTLTITLTIGDTEENRKLAEAIKEKWKEIGVETTIEIFEFSDLNQRVIKNRDYQAILSGTLIEDMSDLYAFWHSSQRSFPGLNISNYASSKMDKNLENLREESREDVRRTLEVAIETELNDETPAIFLYHPKLIYIAKSPLFMSFPVYGISESSRFCDIESWYKQTEKVWKFSYKQKAITYIEAKLH